jgi:hypothetical protein
LLGADVSSSPLGASNSSEKDGIGVLGGGESGIGQGIPVYVNGALRVLVEALVRAQVSYSSEKLVVEVELDVGFDGRDDLEDLGEVRKSPCAAEAVAREMVRAGWRRTLMASAMTSGPQWSPMQGSLARFGGVKAG